MKAMKPGLLIIGEITPRMADSFKSAFNCYYLDQIDDVKKFLMYEGSLIQAIATYGHDGVPRRNTRWFRKVKNHI